jgi:hypothetical protein
MRPARETTKIWNELYGIIVLWAQNILVGVTGSHKLLLSQLSLHGPKNLSSLGSSPSRAATLSLSSCSRALSPLQLPLSLLQLSLHMTRRREARRIVSDDGLPQRPWCAPPPRRATSSMAPSSLLSSCASSTS